MNPQLLYLALLARLAVDGESVEITRRLKETWATMTPEQMREVADALVAAGDEAREEGE